ncbi:MAG TPA: prepilin-type N-terminal cleavage/methylation domain-containing protein [Armatimonadota bacterium]|jgi:prepilin-type N-terminal cleavage/methylation domain-containing protein|nr:prepilin-type N-terminal cleavage/methylation domain-containing protein [Armatimonadota bacterium]
MKSTFRKGFTLIELLVVIAIIAILAAILFPVFAKARSKAHQSACISNMKQIGIAYLAYLDDWDQRFPLWTGPGKTGGISTEDFCATIHSPWVNIDVTRPEYAVGTIALQLDPYIKSREVWACPADFGRFRRLNDWATTDLPWKDWPLRGSRKKVGVSYGYRGTNISSNRTADGYATGKDLGGSTPGWSVAFFSMNDVKRPAAHALFWDHRAWHYSSKNADAAEYNRSRVVELFFDGHVQAVSITEFNDRAHDAGYQSDLRK